MKASELRSGNFIKLFKNGKPHLEWYELDSHDIYKLDESNCVDVEAIPLTEEWLLKFGFEKGVHGDWYKDKMKGWFTKFTSEFGLYSYQFGQYHIASVKYVNELQNLYFALCGEELELK